MYVYHLTKLKMVQYLNYMSVCKIAAKPASDAQVEWSEVSVDVFASDVSSVQIRHGYVMLKYYALVKYIYQCFNVLFCRMRFPPFL